MEINEPGKQENSMIRLYNTLTHKKEEFHPLEEGVVKLYVCGPTVYSDAHVGHAMSALVFDIVRRYLEFRGLKVIHVMNFTDVDDKIILRASQMGVDPFELAEGYIQEYRDHLKDMNILPATINPRATQTMDKILSMIEGLIEKGFAYPASNGDVYFRVNKDKEYGKLSGRRLEDMQAGSRIEVEKLKEHPMDFVLWKSAKPGEPSWESPWGLGRPGWHIECSAMSLHELGEQIDIHGGGNDLIFPHHENEIAQSESYSGKRFSQFWIHNGMLQLSGEKMSKSTGNLITISEFLEAHDGDAMRMLVLNGNYRSPLSFTDKSISAAEQGLNRLRTSLKPANQAAAGASQELVSDLNKLSANTRDSFIEFMDDDLNTSGALGCLFDLVRQVNIARDADATDEQLQTAQDTIRELTSVLGLRMDSRHKEGNADPFIDLLVELRSELRTQKLWSLSDIVRDRLKELGVTIEDSKESTSWNWDK
ncbi:cysteine--tRNA ligase [Chloroflexota bacterium]